MKTVVPTLSIRTPEGIAFNLLLAGIVPRFLAWLVDVAAVVAISLLVDKLMIVLMILPTLHAFLAPILYFVTWLGYGILFEWFWRGQTPGKKLFGLRVMDIQGLRLQFSQVAIRNLLRVVDSLPFFYLVGGVVCVCNRKCQRLGDIAANTIVVRHPKLARPEFEELVGNKYNSLREYPHLAARLRQSVSTGEAGLALDALRRAKALEPQAALELFDDLAEHFKGLVEFPPEAVEFTGPEQYVRNVVDIVYRQEA